MTTEHIQYRSDIDGLRAIAVLAVVIYHASPTALPGGFAGVDYFFVISGYLISKIILKARYAGSFSFKDFYSRRVRRIFPALITVLMASLAIGWFVLTPIDYANLGVHLLGAAGFASNLVLWSEAGYFDQASELKPLLHLWSLGVEEQFYLVWPVVIVLALRARLSVSKVTVTFMVASFGFCLWLIDTDASGAFFSPVTRIWELLIGAMLARVSITQEQNATADQLSAKSRHVLSLLGFVLTLASFFLLDSSLVYPGVWALAPTIGAALLIFSGPSAFINRTILAHPVLVFVGLISYPLYLWHWPLLAFARIDASGEPELIIRLGLMVLALLLAWVTYRVVELPIRQKSHKRFVQPLLLLMVLLGSMGALVNSEEGFPFRYPQNVSDFVNFHYKVTEGARSELCWLTNADAPDAFASECIDSASNRPMIVVWGDSHAARLFPGLKQFVGDSIGISQFTRNSCPPIMDAFYANCLQSNEFVFSQLAELKPQAVVLFAHWSRYVNEEKDRELSLLKDTLQRLRTIGSMRIILVGPSTVWNTSLRNNISQLLRVRNLDRVPRRTTFGVHPSAAISDAILRDNLEGMEGVTYVSAYDTFCNDKGCLIRTGEEAHTMTSWDYGHLTTSAAAFLAEKIFEETDGFRRVNP